ncbi:MAG: DMT family transporter [Candidatus Competibacter sp.]|nr:DMT family transporter [Candidatus Competibacter sp.]
MDRKQGLRQPGVMAVLGAALLFGGGTPLAKALLASADPWLLAGLLYLGSGAGLALYRLARHSPAEKLPPKEWGWLAGAIFAGGVVGPVLLMFGLTGMPASGAALLLNAEGVSTALLAWFVFRENFDRRVALGMAAIVAGALVIGWPGAARFSTTLWPALAVVGACLAWGIDNNLTRKVSLADATWIAMLKGWAAGGMNLALACWLGAVWPPLPTLGGALLVGGLAYGASLALFVVGLRHLGTARTGAYFSVAPFFGAVLAIPLLGEPLTPRLLAAAGLMASGVWLHLTEQHRHPHVHEPMEHDHAHEHDAHHQHPHDERVPTGSPHRHLHRHQPLTHYHAHFPDAHHRHDH